MDTALFHAEALAHGSLDLEYIEHLFALPEDGLSSYLFIFVEILKHDQVLMVQNLCHRTMQIHVTFIQLLLFRHLQKADPLEERHFPRWRCALLEDAARLGLDHNLVISLIRSREQLALRDTGLLANRVLVVALWDDLRLDSRR